MLGCFSLLDLGDLFLQKIIGDLRKWFSVVGLVLIEILIVIFILIELYKPSHQNDTLIIGILGAFISLISVIITAVLSYRVYEATKASYELSKSIYEQDSPKLKIVLGPVSDELDYDTYHFSRDITFHVCNLGKSSTVLTKLVIYNVWANRTRVGKGVLESEFKQGIQSKIDKLLIDDVSQKLNNYGWPGESAINLNGQSSKTFTVTILYRKEEEFEISIYACDVFDMEDYYSLSINKVGS